MAIHLFQLKPEILGNKLATLEKKEQFCIVIYSALFGPVVSCIFVRFYQRETLLHIFFLDIFQVFRAAVSRHPHKNFSDGI